MRGSMPKTQPDRTALDSERRLRYLESVVIPFQLEHMRSRASATNIFIVVEGAAFAFGGTLLPSDVSYVNLALPVFAILAAFSLLLWDGRNRTMISACLEVGAQIEKELIFRGDATPLLRMNAETLHDSRLPTYRGLVSHTWAIRLLAIGSIVFWSGYLFQLL